MQAAMTADEIVTEDLFATIDYNKRVSGTCKGKYRV